MSKTQSIMSKVVSGIVTALVIAIIFFIGRADRRIERNASAAEFNSYNIDKQLEWQKETTKILFEIKEAVGRIEGRLDPTKLTRKEP